MVKSNDDVSPLFAINSHTGATVVKRSLHSTVDQQKLIDRLSSPSHPRYLKNNIPHFKSINSSPNLFQSTGTYNKNLRAAKRIKAVLDNRLKRFRMLDQDEFQEMLKSLSQQTADEQSKASNGMDTIGGMELASKFYLFIQIFISSFSRLLVTHIKRQRYDNMVHTLSFDLDLFLNIYIHTLRFNKKEC
jgi:hypothetical protein